MHLDTGMPGAILSFNVVGTTGFSSHNCITKVKKQVEEKLRILSLIRDQRTKMQGNKGTAKKL